MTKSACELVEKLTADDAIALMVRIYNQGYKAGHVESIDGYYVDVQREDMSTYHQEYVKEFIAEVLSNQAGSHRESQWMQKEGYEYEYDASGFTGWYRCIGGRTADGHWPQWNNKTGERR